MNRHLQRWTSGKPLTVWENKSSASASTSQGRSDTAAFGARPKTTSIRDKSRSDRGKPRSSRSISRENARHRSRDRHSRPSYRKSYSRPSSKLPKESKKWGSTDATASPTSKKYRLSDHRQVCPVSGCGEITRYMKDHVQAVHLPSLFHQLHTEDRGLSNTHRQRLHGLKQLATTLLAPDASISDLMDYVNSRLRDIVHVPTNIWGPLQGDMKALCRFARWSMPDQFEIFPRLNSPASLLYWKIMVYLMGQLSDADRSSFYVTYHSGESPRPRPVREQREAQHSQPSDEAQILRRTRV